MEQDTIEQSAHPNDLTTVPSTRNDSIELATPELAPCPTCAPGATPTSLSYVYAIGRIVTRFPRLSVEKEFNQAASRLETAGQTDQEVAHNVLSKPENRYLAR
jgi:PatG Domain